MLRSKKGILSGLLKPFLLLVLFSIALPGWRPAFAEQESSPRSGLLNDIKKLETRLEKIEADQTAILKKQEDILEQLKILKIWVRRG